MNLIPESVDSDVYCIDLLDYITTNVANRQPQELLNKLTYIYNTHNNTVIGMNSTLTATISSLNSDYDDIEEDINEIETNNDVVNIVGTYAELLSYDTSTLELNDVIKVITDETHNNASTYYRWNGSLFLYDTYERNDIPVTITDSTQVSPDYDVTYIIVGADITLEIRDSNYTVGEHITVIALSRCTVVYNDGPGSITGTTVYPDTILNLYYFGDSTWAPYSPDVFDKIYPVGTVIFSTYASFSPLKGTWVSIDEGLLLMSGTTDIGVESGHDSYTITGVTGTVGEHVLTLSEIPTHTHTLTGTTGNVSVGHTHTVANIEKPYFSSIQSGSAHADTTGSGATNTVNRDHTHTISGNTTGVAGHPGTTTGHSHDIVFNDIDIDIRQACCRLYAYRRVS